MFDRPEILSNQSFVYESRRSLARHKYLQGGQQQFFIIVFFITRYQTLISDIDTFLLALLVGRSRRKFPFRKRSMPFSRHLEIFLTVNEFFSTKLKKQENL